MDNINDIDFNLIEDFLSGKLTPQEEIKFKERLQTDSTFAKEFHFRTTIEKFWNEAETYQATKNQIKQTILYKRRNKKKLFSILAAASVIVLFGISILFYPPKPRIDNKIADSKNDSTVPQKNPLSIKKQVQKGNKYVFQTTFNNNDTIIIPKLSSYPDTGDICLIRISDEKQILIMNLLWEKDSLLIPLSGLKPGEYKWTISNTSFSGNFSIENNVNIKD